MLRMLWRQMTRQKLYTAINLLGLGLGVAVFLTMALIARYEYGYDASVPDAAHVFRIDTLSQPPGEAPSESPEVSFVPFPFLRQDFPAIAAAVRVLTQPLPVHDGARLEQDTVTMTDADFLSIFRLHMVAGDARTALDGPSKAVLPASLAQHLFGTTQALGRTLRLGDHPQPVVVSGVYADPAPNTSNDFGILTRFTSETFTLWPFHNWGSTWGQIWIRLGDPAALPSLTTGLRAYPQRHQGNYTHDDIAQQFGSGGLVPVKLRDVHFHDAAIGAGGTTRGLVDILLLVGVAALATACVNYVNLATAWAGLRAREVAVRKVLGAPRRALVAQFMGEAVAMTAIASLLGLSLCELALRWVDALGGWRVSFDPGLVLPAALAITLFAGGLAGVYPALVLSGFRPAPVLAASTMPSGGRLGSALRNALVVGQFALATGLAICTLVMTHQASFIRALDRGLDQDGVIVIDSLGDNSLKAQQAQIVRRLAMVPGVTLASRSDIYPHHTPDGDRFQRADGTHAVHLEWGYATPDYFQAIGARLLAGRLFDRAHGADFSTDLQKHDTVVISRNLSIAMGFADPQAAIGATVRNSDNGSTRQIIGVIDDIRFGDSRSPVDPLLFFGTDAPFDYAGAIVRFSGLGTPVAMARLRAAWEEIAPDVPFSAQSVPQMFAADYRTDRDHGVLFGIGAAVAIGVACLGLYGLSAFNVSRQSREIGIRKVLGARRLDILVLLGGRFLRPVLLANLIAWPVAWGLMRAWLAGFDRRIPLDAWPFLQVALAATLIAGATVLRQSLRAARQPPAQALQQA